MINVSSVLSSIKASLDSEKTNYWDDSIDILPAINQSINWVSTVIEAAYGRSRFSEEALYGISTYAVHTASLKSSITIDFSIYRSILGVSPNPVTKDNGTQAPPTSDSDLKDKSVNMTNLEIVSIGDVCSRLSLEQWIANERNPFANGNNVVNCDDLKSYSYMNIGDSTSSLISIKIRPDVSRKLVAVFLLKNHEEITSIQSGVIYLNEKLKNIIVDKSLSILTRKDDGKFSLFEVVEDDINNLINQFVK